MAVHYSDNPDLFPLTGSCACGLIGYQLTLPPLLVHCCHCTSCQRQTGSGFAINALIESSALNLVSPAKPIVVSPPSAGAGATETPAGHLPIFAQTTNAVSSTGRAASSNAKPSNICLPTESGVGQTIACCPSCQTTLWNHYADAGPHLSYVRVGTLDHPWEVDPDVHIFTRSCRVFMAITDGKPQFKGYYEDRMDLLRDDARERVRRLQPTVDAWRNEIKAAMQ